VESLLHELADMRREMQSLASFMTSRFTPFVGEDRFALAMDVTTREDDLIVKVELPGVDVDRDVDISVKGSTLHISGKLTTEREKTRVGICL